MAILHGSWIFDASLSAIAEEVGTGAPPYFFVWGETWRPGKPSRRKKAKPTLAQSLYALDLEELRDVLLQMSAQDGLSLSDLQVQQMMTAPTTAKSHQLGWKRITLDLPAQIHGNQAHPHHSSMDFEEDLALYPTTITGLCCPIKFAVEFLAGLPLSTGEDEGDRPGSDLTFWSHVSRWSLDLMARGKFVPVILSTGEVFSAQWCPLLDSGQDHERFQSFVQTMPLLARCYQRRDSKVPKNDLPTEASGLLLQSLQALLDFQLRPCLEADAPQLIKKLGANPIVEQWITALGAEDSTFSQADPLRTVLDEWLHPIRHHLEQDNAFRPCFHLTPPNQGKGQWHMAYFLQALDDPSVLISAETVWNTASDSLQYLGRTVEQPQESLLAGLGLASRIYPQIEESLQGARPTDHPLTAHQAYDFIKAIAWRLEDSGFGVIMPESLSNREGLANRLGLHVKADTVTPTGNQTLGLDSLLNFKWELSIGGQTLSKAEFERLVNLESPLVEINGEWVELRAQDIKAAQSFFGNRRQQTGLSLQDAIRIKSGDTHAFEKLPVVNFESSGILEDLLSTLSGNQTFEPISAPVGFKGELRPYQERGVGWLSMLENWGLGSLSCGRYGVGENGADDRLFAAPASQRSPEWPNSPHLSHICTGKLGA